MSETSNTSTHATIGTVPSRLDVLIETCLEDGHLTASEIKEQLAGRHSLPQVAAMVSMMENRIANARKAAESTRGVERDEWCGAARELRLLRVELLELVASEPVPAK
jgi:hypothetical protein